MKLTSSIVFFLLTTLPVRSQRIFYCDSIIINTTVTGDCFYYYNFLNNSLDSIFDSTNEGTNAYTLNSIHIHGELNYSGQLDGLVSGRINDSLVFEIFFENGYPNGKYVEFYKGDTIGYVDIVLGKKEGRQVYMLYRGSSEIITQNYKNGLLDGPLIIEKNSKIIRVINYKEGLRDGADYAFFEDGMLDWLLIYERGEIKDGVYYTFFNDGSIESEIYYKKGKKRKMIIHGNNGEIIKKESY